MPTIYIASVELFEKNMILGWSKKEKHIQRFVQDSLHDSDSVVISKATFENLGELFECPFDLDMKGIEQDRIERHSKHYLTSLEWDIIDKEFEQFMYTLMERMGVLSIVQGALSEKGSSALRIAMGEIASLDPDELYQTFLDHHKFCHNVGSIEDIMERLVSRRSFQESKQMDEEYRRIVFNDFLTFR